MLRPPSALAVPLRPSLVGSSVGAVPGAPEGFGVLLVAARQAAKANMPQPGGKSGMPTVLAGGTAVPLPEPMAKPQDVSVGRPGSEPSLERDRANPDESVQAKQTPDHSAVVPPPADPVTTLAAQPDPLVAAALLQAAGLIGQTARVPAGAGATPPQADIPPAGLSAGPTVTALPLSPAFGVADTLKPSSLGRSGPQQATQNPMPGEQQASSVTPPADGGQRNVAVSTTPQPTVVAGSTVQSNIPGPPGGPPAPSGTPSASPSHDKPAAGITPRPAIAPATNAPTLVATPAILSDALPLLQRSPEPLVSPAQDEPAVAAPAVPLDMPNPPARSPASSGTPSASTDQSKPAGSALQPTVVAAGSPPALAMATPSILPPAAGLTSTSGERPLVPSGATGTDVVVLRTPYQSAITTPTSPATLADTLQRMTGAGVEGTAKGSGRVGPGLPVGPDALATDLAPAPGAATDARDANPLFDVLEARGPSPAGVDLASASLSGDVAGPIVRQPAREVASVQMKGGTTGTQATDPQIVPVQTNDMQAAPASGAASVRSPAHDAAPSAADQVAPAVVAMAQNHGAGGRLSISITPDQLGQVHITVERAADGTTTIHVAAEQLATLDLLRQDQGSLHRALDQAGVGQEGHSLSFSWDGSGGGMPGWGSPSHQPGESPPADVSLHTEETVSAPSVAAAARGGIDVTA